MAHDIEDESRVARFSEQHLRQFSFACLESMGVSRSEALLLVEGVLTAALWWHPGQGQGMEKLYRYQDRLAAGGIRASAPMQWLHEGPSYALLDAANGFGYVAGHRAMDRAIQLAHNAGIGMVGVRRSNHFGMSGYHAWQAAQAGLIGIVMTNAGAEMAPWGATRPVLGTNPWGVAIPRRDADPIVLDMALTMSGKGMMRWYMESGRPIPAHWALTPEGQTTIDPAAAMDGPVLPIGDYKGVGLSLVTDILAGVMTGALFGGSVFQDPLNFDVGHLMLALRVDNFQPRAQFEARLEALLAEVKAAPPLATDRPVRLPGEIEFARMRARRQHGIPVARKSLPRLQELARMLGVAFPPESTGSD